MGKARVNVDRRCDITQSHRDTKKRKGFGSNVIKLRCSPYEACVIRELYDDTPVFHFVSYGLQNIDF